jgi:tripartite ATP-independent transporter DctM subunit
MAEAVVGPKMTPAAAPVPLGKVAGRLFLPAEIIAAALLVAVIVVMAAGVVARYVFVYPFVWSDELAGILFLWISVLGAVLALHHAQHLRLTTFIARRTPRTRIRLELACCILILGFVGFLVLPAIQSFLGEIAVVTPALGISDGWRAAAMTVGVFAMGAVALGNLVRLLVARDSARRDIRWLVPALALIFVILARMSETLSGLGNYNLLIYFAGLVVSGMVIGLPIGFAFGIASLSYLAFATDLPLTIVINRIEVGMSHPILLSIPLFVVLGLMMEMTGMARAMVAFLASLLGHVRGGLSYVLLGAMYLISGIAGAKTADMAAVAPALFPEMRKRGANPGELVSLLASSSVMSETIPPSVVLIAIASVTGVSIGALFAGGLLPALLLAIVLCVVARFRASDDDVRGAARPKGRVIVRRFFVALPALLLPFVIRTAVVEGVATATEVATIGIVYVIVIGIFVYREFDWRRLFPIFRETVSMSGAILFIVGTADIMSWSLTQSGFSQDLTATLHDIPGGAGGFMAVSILVFIVFGSVLEGIPAVLLFGPLLFPIARSFGIDEVHFAMVAVLAMGLGLYAPPFGVGYYTACAIGNVDPDQAMTRIWPYLGALALGVVVIAAVPWISTVLIPH